MTDMPGDAPNQLRFTITLPPELEAGVYANFASIWRDNEGFILDFVVTTHPPTQQDDADGSTYLTVPSRVVSRVRIPSTQAWEFMRGLNEQLTAWENEHGRRSADPEI
jgi:hypothetical protein